MVDVGEMDALEQIDVRSILGERLRPLGGLFIIVARESQRHDQYEPESPPPTAHRFALLTRGQCAPVQVIARL